MADLAPCTPDGTIPDGIIARVASSGKMFMREKPSRRVINATKPNKNVKDVSNKKYYGSIVTKLQAHARSAQFRRSTTDSLTLVAIKPIMSCTISSVTEKCFMKASVNGMAGVVT